MTEQIKKLEEENRQLHDIAGSYAQQIASLTAERDLFKKETVALAKHSTRFQSGLERVIDAGAEGCCKYCDIKTDIAKEALGI